MPQSAVHSAAPAPFVSRPLLLVALASCAGIAADRFLAGIEWLSAPQWWTAAVVAAAAGMCLINFGYLRGSTLALAATFFCIAGSWHNYRWNYVAHDDVTRFATVAAEPVCLQAIARSTPQWTPAARASPLRAIPAEPQTELEIELTAIRAGQTMRPTSGRTRLRINGIRRELNPGDDLVIYAQLAKPRSAQNPGQYDYAEAERAAGRHCELFTRSPACLQVVHRGSRISLAALTTAAKNSCQRQLDRYVGSSQSAIAQAMFLGDRTLLDDETTEAFLQTGTVHLLVVSGLHVGLLAGAWWLLCGWIGYGKNMQLVTTLLLVLAYATIVGGRPPVQRASILVASGLLALAAGRAVSQLNLLAFANLAVVACSPAEVFRGGTQLSFLGVAGIWAFLALSSSFRREDPLNRMFAQYWTWWQHFLHGAWKGLVGLVAVSAAVWLFVAPLVLFHFNILTPCGLLIGPLLWPLVAIALVSGLAICSVGFVFPPLAWLLGKVCGASLWLTDATVRGASQMPAGHFYLPAPPAWWLTLLYGGILVAALRPAWHRSPLRLVSFVLLWFAFGLGQSALIDRRSDELRCSFVSVGHGTCVLLEFPTGENVLYDAGGLGSPRTIANIVSAVLWDRGIRHLDAVVLSHADVDHYNAVPDLLTRFPIDRVIVSPVMFEPWADPAALNAPNFLRRALSESQTQLNQVWMNDRIRVSEQGVNIEVLHPPRFGVGGRDNANSLVLLVEYAGKRILLPGDLESPGLENVMAEAPLDVDVLLAPHHGSSQSDPPGFARWSQPEWVVLSGGHTDPGGQFAVESYGATGAKVLQTAETGCITFSITSSGVLCRTFHHGSVSPAEPMN